MTTEENNNNRIAALMGTLLFHGLLLLLFLFIVFKTPIPPFPEAGSPGIEVNFGTSENGMGEVQPREATSLKNSQAPALTEEIKTKIEKLAAPKEDAVITQETEDAPEVLKEKPKVESVTKPVETPVKEVETPKPVVNTSSIYKGKSKTEGGSSGSEGGQERHSTVSRERAPGGMFQPASCAVHLGEKQFNHAVRVLERGNHA